MSRSLRWSCHGVVLVWCLALFVEQWQQQLGVDTTPLPVVARVHPVPEPAPKAPDDAPVPKPEAEKPAEPEPEAEKPAEPEPEPPPEPKPAPEPQRAEPRPTPVSARDFTRGSGLLDGGGAFPALSFGYDEFPSFISYARSMVGLGARFVVVRNRQIVGSVDLDSRSVSSEPLGTGFSPRARDYTSEPGLASVAAAARERFGAGSVVMMLVPRSLDAGLFGGLARVLSEHGESHARLSEVRGSYQRLPGGGVRLRVDRALRRDGSSVDVEAVFDLGAIAGGVHS